jgi:N-acetylglucosaminyldiphosphoundecaprenol N-acetyl-beta-D-mannosaminyltransferase
MTNTHLNKARVRLFGMDIDPINMSETVGIVSLWLKDTSKVCKFVVTPNVDHVVNYQTNQLLRDAYHKASLVVTDGKPVVWAANMLGTKLPGTVPGSDLVPALFDFVQMNKTPTKVFLLGAMPGVADRAKVIIHQSWPQVEVVGTLSPDFGFEKDAAQCKKICEIVNTSQAELLILGLGAPKQELWIAQHYADLTVNVALCVGATIDFIAGEVARAPVWMRKVGLEWLYRVLMEPKRLAKRYLHGALEFPKIVLKEWQIRRNA